MASATGIPENPSALQNGHEQQPVGEDEPLLGQRGDQEQPTTTTVQSFFFNLVSGTAILSQLGIWILTALVWASVFNAPNLIFFSAHPLLNSAGILFLTQSILLLQPTHTPRQKSLGTHVHFILNFIGIGALISGLVVIEINKASHPETRFTSVHGILGLVTYILIFASQPPNKTFETSRATQPQQEIQTHVLSIEESLG